MSGSAFQIASQSVIDEAARWASMFDSGDADEAEIAAFQDWCRADPVHKRTFERICAIDRRIDQAGDMERTALDRVLHERKRSLRRSGGIMSAIVLTISLGWVSARSDFVRDHFPDYETRRGEQREVALTDGSELVIDTDGAVRVRMDGKRRIVRLLRGQVFVEVARDPSRPFVIETDQGDATALGTAFMVNRSPLGTIVTVTQSHVRVCPGASEGMSDACRELAPGERAKIAGGQVVPLQSVDPENATLWTSGWLEADEMDVGDVLAELNRYRDTPIRYDPVALRGIKVTGSIPLKDSDRAMLGIASTKGLRIRRENEDIEVVRAH